MGMYTGIRFKGYVKPEFRKNFEDVALNGVWEDNEIKELREFGKKFSRASFIPCGSLAYMPDEWEFYNDKLKKYSNEWWRSARDTDGFDRTYDKDTGYWAFQCSLKNYEHEIENWFTLLPLFIESIDHLEYFYEEWEYSVEYDFISGGLMCVNDKFIKYY